MGGGGQGGAEAPRCVGLQFVAPYGPLCRVGFTESAWGSAAMAAGRTHQGAGARAESHGGPEDP